MPRFTNLFVAVHGIGAQQRNATLRSVGTRIAGSSAIDCADHARPLAPQPLGYFHSFLWKYQGVTNMARASALDRGDGLGSFYKEAGFAEVFWADIPQKLAEDKSTLEETKAWARTVVARADRLCKRAEAKWKASRAAPGGAPSMESITPPDFSLAAEVLDEIIDTVHVLENLTYLADKAGIFTFDLQEVLDEYLGDVQIVAEYADERWNIVGNFHRSMRDLYEEQVRLGNPDVKLHVVAHSEGTVVAFLGLLYALAGMRVRPFDEHAEGDARRPGVLPAVEGELEWVRHVHGFMTIGSPLDKHLLLWDHLWTDFENLAVYPVCMNGVRLFHGWDSSVRRGQIKWRNYYDYGDPVGFKLDTVRDWLKIRHCDRFEFDDEHDFGFSRYVLPGKAHNDYWADADVFDHFVHSAKLATAAPSPVPQRSCISYCLRSLGEKLALPRKDRPKIAARHRLEDAQRAAGAPQSRLAAMFWSHVIPYLVSFCILFAGCFILYKNVTAYMHPGLDQVQKFIRFVLLSTSPKEASSGRQLCSNALGVTCLVAGTTIMSRLLRLSRKGWVLGGGAVCFLLGCAGYWKLCAAASRRMIGLAFALPFHGDSPHQQTLAATFGVILCAILLIAICDIAQSHKWKEKPGERKSRWFWRDMRPLIFIGVAMIGILVVFQDQASHRFEADTKLGPKARRFFSDLKKPAETPAHQTGKEILQKEDVKNLERDIKKGVATGLIPQAKLETVLGGKLKPQKELEAVQALQMSVAIANSPRPFWPVLVALAAFLYLWWLAALLFDLTFVWHYYIRRSKSNDALHKWRKMDWHL